MVTRELPVSVRKLTNEAKHSDLTYGDVTSAVLSIKNFESAKQLQKILKKKNYFLTDIRSTTFAKTNPAPAIANTEVIKYCGEYLQ